MTSPFGKGIGFPPRIGPNGRMLWSEGERNIRESIAIILKTNPLERVALPRFGAGLGRYLFEPNIAATHAGISDAIVAALGQWEPRIVVEAVEVAADPAEAQAAVATISYKLVTTGALETLAVAVPVAGD